MSNHPHEHRTVEPILDAIANWVRRYRQAVGLRGALANCGAEEVARIARDIGVSPDELIFIANKGPHAADELPKLLRALGVDPQKLASDDPVIMRSLQRICISCGHKNQCQHDLAAGTAASHHRDYCPNAMSLDALFHSK
jgi:transcriptional regulator with XRE-family HTH domain